MEAIHCEDGQARVRRDDHADEDKAAKVYFVSGLDDGQPAEALEGLDEGGRIKIKPSPGDKRRKRSG